MSSQSADTQTLAVLQQVDDVCLRFEDRWKAGDRPALEAFLHGIAVEQRGELLPELLLLEWSYRASRGETIDRERYAEQFASLRPQVDHAWQRWRERSQARQSETVEFRLPGYEQVQPLGKGGMGEVCKAFDPRLKRWVALKQVRLDAISLERVARFRLEAEALAMLQHPHIVKVHDYPERDGQPVLVMEYVAGGTLEERLAGRSPLEPGEAARLVLVLAWAVHAAHEKGIVHRDLKPANVLMDAMVEGSADNVLGGYPKISDFGLAALVGEATGETVSGLVLGTPAYMAPEQAAGRTREVGPKTDVWALGVILYRCLTGTLPFAGDSVLDTLERVKTMPLPPLREVRPEVPSELEAVCQACLHKSLDRRPTAAKLATWLERLASGKQVPEHVATTAFRLRRPRWPRWVIAASAAVAAVLLVVAASLQLAGSGWISRRNQPDSPAVKVQPPADEAVKVARWNVRHYREEGVGKDFLLGVIGSDSWMTRYKDKVVIEAELSRPAYAYLIGFNFDGKEQLLLPCDTSVKETPGDPRRRPKQAARLVYPPVVPGNAEHAFELSDDARGGLQAFVVVASAKPLPAYEEWSKKRGAAPWRRIAGGNRVWWSNAEKLDSKAPGPEVVDRGIVVQLNGQPPLLALCRWARDEDVEAVAALAFPVNPREGR
jgi:serine/threonine protein kinase